MTGTIHKDSDSGELFDQSVGLILDALPEYYDPEGRKVHALTRRDGELIASMIKLATQHTECKTFTCEQAAAVVRMVDERKKILALVGAAAITVFGYIGQKVLDAIDPGIWKRIAHVFGILK